MSERPFVDWNVTGPELMQWMVQFNKENNPS